MKTKTPLAVLIVEDSPEDAELLIYELQRGNYDVSSARVDTAAAMKAALEHHTWDIVLSDYMVPGFGALEALAVLQDAHPDLPLILISGAVSEETAFEALKAGARDFLIKGQLTRLLPAIERELNEATLRRKLRMADQERHATWDKYRNLVENTPNGVLAEHHLQAQKMEAIGQLAGGVAHDFNNLLTVILGNAEIVCGELAQDHPLRQEVLEIQKAGQQAAELTRQLLSFSRKQMLQPVVLNLNAVITKTLQLLRRLIGSHIECVTTLADDLGMVLADPAQLEQMLMNLTVNARDAMPGGGRLTITTWNVDLDPAFVHAHLGASLGPHVVLEVRDTGAGMDEETLRHIFEPFFTTKGPGKGTGLGLATIYGVVKQSEGYIEVDSVPGLGTVFRVYLPRTVRGADILESPAARPRLGRTGTILLVDDEPSILLVSEKALTRSGFNVVASSNPQDALARLERLVGHLDLLVTDLVMPGTSGVNLYRSLMVTRPDLPVLYMSGDTHEGAERLGLVEPGIAFLQKPFTPATLVEKVQAVLEAGATSTAAWK